MTDTLDPASISPARPSRAQISQSLGGHPAAKHLTNAAMVFGTMFAVAIVLWFCGPLGKAAALVIAGIALLLSFLAFGRSLGALANGAQFYTPAVEAVAQGKLGCSYAVRGVICKGGIAVVDEVRKLVWLNGALLKFDEIRRLGTESVGHRHELMITARSGAHPVTTLCFDSEAPMRQAYARLTNTLGFK